ncbi:MAG TPA: CBS domain-containing protein, partial [Desulfobacteria bacterium]|nr:CBS domain-containing protein [Desulfobacteria bacterium]
KAVDLTQVTRLILVDTRSPSRIGSLQQLVTDGKVEIYSFDHHPAAPDDVRGAKEVYAHVGAVTTLMVELLKTGEIPISPFEATLLALGIYEDTGNLLFEGTTARDAAAVSYLLEKGANLKLVADFIERPLTKEQKDLLNLLLQAARHYLIKGARVLITSAVIDRFIGGLALLTHKVGEIENLDLIFAIVRMDDRVHIVARGRGKRVAVNEVLREFGGAGHPKAASATVKDGDVQTIIHKILDLLAEMIVPEISAREIMTAPVHSAPSSASMEAAGEMMRLYGHTGLPIVDAEQLVGIISRRDVDKAIKHGLGHAPVTGYMSRAVITVQPEASLGEVEDLMIEHDIGRLPVVNNSRLVGIISRSDVLRSIHGQAIPVNEQILNGRSMVQSKQMFKLLEELPLEIRDLFQVVKVLAQEQGVRVYVVGGLVRDLLQGVNNLDIDLVVEGDGPAFAACLAEKLRIAPQVYPQFATASLRSAEGLRIDVVTARTESYDAPAALPQVAPASLKQDLHRRDFTLNTMAVALAGDDFGVFYDYYGGYRDLLQRQIRVLHNLSFVDDPTRILRAVRFEQRLGFKIEPQTWQLLKGAVAAKHLNLLSRDRLKCELSLTLQEKSAARVIQRLAELGAWEQILPGVAVDDLVPRFEQAVAGIEFLAQLGCHLPIEVWEVRLAMLFANLHADEAEGRLRQLNFERRLIRAVRQFLEIRQTWTGITAGKGELNRSIIHRSVGNAPLQVIAALLATTEFGGPLREYLQAKAQTTVFITGKDLQSMGIPSGPVYRRILSALWDARLLRKVRNREEELALIQTLLKEEIDVY